MDLIAAMKLYITQASNKLEERAGGSHGRREGGAVMGELRCNGYALSIFLYNQYSFNIFYVHSAEIYKIQLSKIKYAKMKK